MGSEYIASAREPYYWIWSKAPIWLAAPIIVGPTSIILGIPKRDRLPSLFERLLEDYRTDIVNYRELAAAWPRFENKLSCLASL